MSERRTELCQACKARLSPVLSGATSSKVMSVWKAFVPNCTCDQPEARPVSAGAIRRDPSLQYGAFNDDSPSCGGRRVRLRGSELPRRPVGSDHPSPQAQPAHRPDSAGCATLGDKIEKEGSKPPRLLSPPESTASP